MARARSFRRGGISDSQRRKKSWVQITGPPVDTAGGFDATLQTPLLNFVLADNAGGALTDSNSVGFFSDPLLDKIPAESTILRLRGSLNMPKNAVGGSALTFFAFGIGVMEATAAALGGFPNPATPEGGAWDGWLQYRSQQTAQLDANASIFDAKSMRKVQSGYAIVVVFGRYRASTDGQVLGASGVNDSMQLNARGLILLP